MRLRPARQPVQPDAKSAPRLGAALVGCDDGQRAGRTPVEPKHQRHPPIGNPPLVRGAVVWASVDFHLRAAVAIDPQHDRSVRQASAHRAQRQQRRARQRAGRARQRTEPIVQRDDRPPGARQARQARRDLNRREPPRRHQHALERERAAACARMRRRRHARQMRRSASVPLVPPKPKEFFSATPIGIERASLAQ